MSILGTRVARIEDPRFLTEGGRYMADFRDPLLDGALYVTFVRSTLAHGTFTVDMSEAAAAPGVHAVFTHADLDIGPMPPAIFMLNPLMVRPVLSDGRVRFVGEPIAAIISERPEQGRRRRRARDRRLRAAARRRRPRRVGRNEVLLFEEAGTNSAFELMVGHSDDLFEGCEVVVKQRVMNPRVNSAACPLEVRGAAAAWDANGKLNLWLSTQQRTAPRRVATSSASSLDGSRAARPTSAAGSAPRPAPIPKR